MRSALSQNDIEEIDFLLHASADDLGHAKCVLRLHPDRLAYSSAYGWLAYTGTHWQREDAEMIVDELIIATLQARVQTAAAAGEAYTHLLKAGNRPNAPAKNRVKDVLKHLCFVPVAAFDREPFLFNAANGVVDLRTGELLPHVPRNYFSYCASAEFRTQADRSLWTRFLADTLQG